MPDSDLLLKRRPSLRRNSKKNTYHSTKNDADLSLKKVVLGAPDGTGPNSTTSNNSCSFAALVHQERSQRTARERSNEATYPGTVCTAGPAAESSDLERQGMIIIGSDRNTVVTTTEQNNQ
jgi:hypothetical protein